MGDEGINGDGRTRANAVTAGLQATPENSVFALANTEKLGFPVLLAVPHAGRNYSNALMKNLQTAPSALPLLEDRYADLLVRDAIIAGFPAIMAHTPRAWIDLNRRPDEIDADSISDRPRSAFAQPSSKVRGGLGLVPTRLNGYGNLWRDKWQQADIDARIQQYHAPYHAAIDDILQRMCAQFGQALLLDVHSMPPLSPSNGVPPPQCVIGDLFGRSANGRFSDHASLNLRQMGYRVALNHPYAGGYVMQRHGRPQNNIHALQLEFDRSLYLQNDLLEPSAQAASLARKLGDLAGRMADLIADMSQAQAAE